MYEYFRIATLEPEGVAKINELEEKFGKHIMAIQVGGAVGAPDCGDGGTGGGAREGVGGAAAGL